MHNVFRLYTLIQISHGSGVSSTIKDTVVCNYISEKRFVTTLLSLCDPVSDLTLQFPVCIIGPQLALRLGLVL